MRPFTVPVTIEAYFSAGDGHRLDIPDAVVDPRVVGLLLPDRVFAHFGFDPADPRSALHVVRLTILGRDCPISPTRVPDDRPVTVGHVPLTMLDWVIDPAGQRLIGNPDHGGRWMMDAYGVR